MTTEQLPVSQLFADLKGSLRDDRIPALNSPYGEYERSVVNIVRHGKVVENERTGVGTLAIFGNLMRFNLFPAPYQHDPKEVPTVLPVLPVVTSKFVHLHSVIHELLWMLSGSTNIAYLKANKVRIWDEWADKNGDLGPIYGKQWRDFNGVDQIKYIVDTIRKDPGSRRLVLNAWNPADLSKMALTPCHTQAQFSVRDGLLSCKMDMRSNDAFLGLPFNIAQYAFLTHMIAACCDLTPNELIVTQGDLHIYSNHTEQVRTMLARDPKPYPRLQLTGGYEYPWEYKYEDFKVIGYEHHPAIPAPVAV